MTRPFATAFRIGITALSAVAWLAVSNHCVLAGGVPSKQATGGSMHQHCPGHQTPEKKDGKPANECCKTLSITPAQIGKQIVGYYNSEFAPVDFAPLWFGYIPIRSAVVPAELDTGPPRFSSFAESVLQRSVLAHAPPSRA